MKTQGSGRAGLRHAVAAAALFSTVAACEDLWRPGTYVEAYRTEPTCEARCPAEPQELTGTVEAGGACQRVHECAPVCCPCGEGVGDGGSVLVASCRLGKCQGVDQLCAEGTRDRYCFLNKPGQGWDLTHLQSCAGSATETSSSAPRPSSRASSRAPSSTGLPSSMVRPSSGLPPPLSSSRPFSTSSRPFSGPPPSTSFPPAPGLGQACVPPTQPCPAGVQCVGVTPQPTVGMCSPACSTDAQCGFAGPGSGRCMLTTGSGGAAPTNCGIACGFAGACPAQFICDPQRMMCVPIQRSSSSSR